MVDDLFDIERAADGDQPVAIVVRVRLETGAGRSEVTGRHANAVRVRVAAAPSGERATEEGAAVLADLLGIAADNVEPLRPSGRLRRFRVSGVEPEQARRSLERGLATNLPGTGSGHAMGSRRR